MSANTSRVARRARVAGGAALLAASVLCTPRGAQAQQATFYLDRIQIPGNPEDSFVVFRPRLHEKTRFFGSTALGYTLNPLRADTVTDNPNVEAAIGDPVDHQFITYLSAGGEFASRVGVSLSLPVALYQGGGSDPIAQGVGIGMDRPAVAAHDLRLTATVKAWQSNDRRFVAGGGFSFWMPTGNDSGFAGDGQSTGMIFGSLDYDFGPFQVAGLIGPHFRPDRGIAGDEGVLEVGTEFRWAGSIFVPIRQGDVRLAGSLWGSTGLVDGARSGESTFFGGRNTNTEWLGEIRFKLLKDSPVYASGGAGTRMGTGYGGPDVRLLASIGAHASLFDTTPGQVARRQKDLPKIDMYDKDTDGDGFPDDIDGCPTIKEDGLKPRPSDGCPGPKDRDGDGIIDDVDKCPDDPEDRDGIEDGDGCPEEDADKDGILDVDDACALTPGVANKDPKKNGCKAAPKKIIDTGGGIQLLEAIQFDTGKSTVKPVSYPILDEVVDVLKSRPEVRMGVYGHTDNRGGAQMNRDLSKARAAAVVEYLIDKGVAKARLESDGFGPDRPLESNASEAGRTKNRRVEFKVLD